MVDWLTTVGLLFWRCRSVNRGVINMLNVDRKIPLVIQSKAEQILQRYQSGNIHAKKLKCGYGYSLQVGDHYRLLSQDDKKSWLLLTHERYNKLVC